MKNFNDHCCSIFPHNQTKPKPGFIDVRKKNDIGPPDFDNPSELQPGIRESAEIIQPVGN